MTRFLAVFSGILFSILFVGFFTNYSASAASPYDGFFTDKLTDNLVLRNGECDSQNISQNYVSHMVAAGYDDDFPERVTAADNARNKFTTDILNENSSWMIVQSSDSSVVFRWTTDVSNSTTLTTYNGTNRAFIISPYTRTQNYRMQIVMHSDCSIGLQYASGYVSSPASGTSTDISDGTPQGKLFLSTFEFIAPEGYEGTIPPDSWEPDAPKENLRPEYTYQVSPSGKLSINYTKNLKTFLTGTSFFVLEKMNENWEGVDENVYSNLAYTPAGLLTGDSKFAVLNQAENIDMVVPEKGYYMIRIDHNQQLDTPPWVEDAGDKYNIEQVFLQFYWDGSSVVIGDNIGGCDGGICNPEKGNNKILIALRKFNIDDHGLQAIIFIPLEFFATLPSITQTCTPLNIPFIDRNMSIQCIREPLNQAHPALVFLISVFINGIVTLGVAFALFRHIKNLHDPKRDEIEVLKL